MYIPVSLKKVNEFRDVAIPSNRSYFARLGEMTPPPSQYTGEEVALMGQSKIDQIADYEAYARQMDNESKSD